MAAYWALAILAAAVVSNANGNRIVGGEPTSIDKYPSIVQVEFYSWLTGSWSQSCAANILNSYYVVSAAHCFDGWLFSAATRRIRAGTSDRNYGGVVINVEWRINHHHYGLLGDDSDITLVRLVSALVYNQVIQPGKIVPQGYELPYNLPVVLAGWGTTESEGLSSPVLRDVTIYTINNDLCTERYAALSTTSVVTENMICAGILDVGGKDACQGDFGGPLYYQEFQVGVVSWGADCADAHYPRVSTRVASYSDWIVATAV